MFIEDLWDGRRESYLRVINYIGWFMITFIYFGIIGNLILLINGYKIPNYPLLYPAKWDSFGLNPNSKKFHTIKLFVLQS